MASIRAKLTESVIKNIPLEITRITDTELSGFYLNLGKPNKDGKSSLVYYLYYRLGGRGSIERRLALGRAPALSVVQARELAKQDIGDVFLEQKERTKTQNKKLKRLQSKN